MARAISRPSVAVVTWQELARRYFAISVRVSRSSSTTRMFGATVAMRTLLSVIRGDWRRFLFLNVSYIWSVTPGNIWRTGKKTSLTLLTIPSRRLARPRSWSHHDRDFPDFQQQLPEPPAEARSRAAVGGNFGSRQFVRPVRALLGAERHQFIAAERLGERFRKCCEFFARRSEIEDRHPDRQRMGQQEIFPPRLSTDLRHSSRYSQGRTRTAPQRVRRQPFWNVPDHQSARDRFSRRAGPTPR